MAVKLLIVEDENVLRENLCELLTMEGYEVKSAINGQEALKLLGNFSPDLILCDIKMPDMDGYEICRRMKDDPTFRATVERLQRLLETQG